MFFAPKAPPRALFSTLLLPLFILSNDITATSAPLPYARTNAAILLQAFLRVAKKIAFASVQEDGSDEAFTDWENFAIAETGALSYGIISAVTDYRKGTTCTMSPLAGLADTAGYVATYWLTRKLYDLATDTDTALTIQEGLSLDEVPDIITDLSSKVLLMALANIFYTAGKTCVAYLRA